MLGLLVSTILTSAADSLNPIAISQQFVLQGMVKKAKHIWYFIVAIGLTNFASGFLAYFGLITPISNFMVKVIGRYGQSIFTLELILGIVFLIAVCYWIQNVKIESLRKQIPSLNTEGDHKKEKKAGEIKSVSPASLAVLGIVATISELTTALPYFAFLAILFNHQLSLVQVTLILLVYNLIYSLPLIILYFVYIKAQDKFDHFYLLLKKQMEKWAVIFVPMVMGMIGVLLIFHSTSRLLK